MSPEQLERATLRPYLFIHKLASSKPYRLRERVVRLPSHPLPSNTMMTDDDIADMRILAGGRYVVTGSSEGKVICWDMGHQNTSRDPEPVVMYKFDTGFAVVFVGASPEPVKRLDAGRPQIMVACNHSAGYAMCSD